MADPISENLQLVWLNKEIPVSENAHPFCVHKIMISNGELCRLLVHPLIRTIVGIGWAGKFRDTGRGNKTKRTGDLQF